MLLTSTRGGAYSTQVYRAEEAWLILQNLLGQTTRRRWAEPLTQAGEPAPEVLERGRRFAFPLPSVVQTVGHLVAPPYTASHNNNNNNQERFYFEKHHRAACSFINASVLSYPF